MFDKQRQQRVFANQLTANDTVTLRHTCAQLHSAAAFHARARTWCGLLQFSCAMRPAAVACAVLLASCVRIDGGSEQQQWLASCVRVDRAHSIDGWW